MTERACLIVSLLISTIGSAHAAGAPSDVIERGHYLANAGGASNVTPVKAASHSRAE